MLFFLSKAIFNIKGIDKLFEFQLVLISCCMNPEGQVVFFHVLFASFSMPQEKVSHRLCFQG